MLGERLTKADVGEMWNGANHEEDPHALISLALDQAMPRDLRRHAAEKLNDMRGAALGYIRFAPLEIAKGMSRSGLFASDFLSFAKARLAAIQSEPAKPAAIPELTIEEKIERLERDNEAMRQRISNRNGHGASSNAANMAALERARNCRSIGNMAEVTRGMMAKGIAIADIKPGENCLTYGAWLALGRCVKHGERGVKVGVISKLTKEEANKDTGEIEKKSFARRGSAAIFHISQTEVRN